MYSEKLRFLFIYINGMYSGIKATETVEKVALHEQIGLLKKNYEELEKSVSGKSGDLVSDDLVVVFAMDES